MRDPRTRQGRRRADDRTLFRSEGAGCGTGGEAHRDSLTGQLRDGQSRVSLERLQAILVICDSVTFCTKQIVTD